jgi:hypothetical protein
MKIIGADHDILMLPGGIWGRLYISYPTAFGRLQPARRAVLGKKLPVDIGQKQTIVTSGLGDGAALKAIWDSNRTPFGYIPESRILMVFTACQALKPLRFRLSSSEPSSVC